MSQKQYRKRQGLSLERRLKAVENKIMTLKLLREQLLEETLNSDEHQARQTILECRLNTKEGKTKFLRVAEELKEAWKCGRFHDGVKA